MMFAAFRLRRIRLREQKKLNESYLCLFKNITAYIQSSNLTVGEKEEVLQQIMDLMLQAQIEGKPIDLFIGKDYEVFCKSIIDEFNNSKSKLYKTVNYIQRYLVIMTSIVIVMGVSNVLNGEVASLSVKVGQFIFANEITLLLITLSRLRRQGPFVPVYLPFYNKINYRNSLNERSIVGPLFYFVIIITIIDIVIKKLLGADIVSNYIVFYDNICYGFFMIALIGLIEGYMIMYNKKQ